MFSFDKLVKKNVIHSAGKNTSAHPVQSTLMPGAGHKNPYAIQEVPCFNQTMVPATNIPLRLQKVSVQRWNSAKQQVIQSQKPAEIQQIASIGVQGTGQRLPHVDRIQKAFGHHNISSVKAYLGTKAISASRLIGARAYATGNKVAFADSMPDLHTTAHEAAHIIQQRAGVHLKGGVGEVGDHYEQQADKVADNVVQGKSAESLLDSHAGPSSNKAGLNAQQLQSQTAVQRAVGYEFETGWLVEVEETTTSSYFNPKFYYSKFKSLPLNRFKKRRSLKKKEKIIDVTSSDGYKIEADEAKNGKSELEFITYPPIPEGAEGLKRLKKVMKKLTVFGKQLEAEARKAAGKKEEEKPEKEEIMEMEPKKEPEMKSEKIEFSIQGVNNKKFYITPESNLKLTGGPQVTSGLDLSVIPRLASLSEKLKLGVMLQSRLKPLSKFDGEVPKNISPKLKGLLAVIVNYLRLGKADPYADKNDEVQAHLFALGYPKQIGNTLLARTQFSKLFKLLPEDEQKQYREHPEDWVKLVLTAAGNLDPKESVIESGIREEDEGINTMAVNKFKLTRYDWLIGILNNVDKLRKMKDAESLGEFKNRTEKVGPDLDKEAGIFEFRAMQGEKMDLRSWRDFAINFFKLIMLAHGKKAKHERKK